MTGSDLLHSRIVGGLRIALPLAALGVLSTLFLFSRDIDPSRALPFAAVDAEDLARDPRITAPRFSGVTDDGSAVTLTAGSVRIASGTDETIRAEAVTALLEAPDGGQSRIVADSARIDRAADRLDLAGDVRIVTAGYRIHSEALVLRLDQSWAHSPGTVRAEGPAGRLEAGRLTILRPPGADTGTQLRFAGGVRMVYHPGQGRGVEE